MYFLLGWSMNEEEYMKTRVDDQIGWYDAKSQRAQKYFKRLSGSGIVAAAAIPVVAGFGEGIVPVKVTVGVLGALVAILSSVVNLNQYQKNWVGYRAACESLKHEKFLFLAGAGPYSQGKTFQDFVQRVEKMISVEHSNWIGNASNDDEGKHNGQPG